MWQKKSLPIASKPIKKNFQNNDIKGEQYEKFVGSTIRRPHRGN